MFLGDKACAGGNGESVQLLSPIKRNEDLYRKDREASKTFNRALSKTRIRHFKYA